MTTLYVGPDIALARRLIRFLQSDGRDLRGTNCVVEVLHDHYCPKLRGEPCCRCEPEFRIAGCVA